MHEVPQQTNDVAPRTTNTTIDLRTTNTTIDLRLLAMYAEASGLVGMDGPTDELIQLMGGEDEVKVLSIVGFGGLGKTTLANEIYCKLQGEFQCRAFVSVSQKPNIRKLLRTMLSQVGFVAPMDTNMEIWEETEFISALRKFLLKQRYLIVIDDIWEAPAWDIIRCALPENINGSRVLITTRIETVARACCAKNIECVYKMKALSDRDSRSLFFKRIFGAEEACPPYLMEVSAQILKKCGGLPLAIITTSSLIASQPSKLKEHWEHVRDSLGSSFEVSPSLDGMRQILNLSYINLPHYLKTCMLYLGIYPEDYTINKNDLVRQWVSEGFICEGRGTDPEDIAKSYFNELINRSLIQPVDTDYNGEVMSCRVHDMMLDLILYKSREDNFISVMDDIQDLTRQPAKIRRLSLSLDGAIDETVGRSFQLSQTRMLARFGTSLYLPPILQFKHLRVLTIEISSWPYSSELLDLNGICHLFQLGFLKIIASGRHVVLPSKIGRLQQLKTFEIDAGQSDLQLPSDIVHLSRLWHLIVPRKVIFPSGISNMKSLRTPRCFDLRNSLDNIKGLRELTNLTNVEISYSDNTSTNRDEFAAKRRELVHALGNICSLKCLIFNNYLPVTLIRACLDSWCSVPTSFIHLQSFRSWFSRIPGWIGQHHSLYDLQLGVQDVYGDDVGILSQLPSLVCLHLHIHGVPKDKIIIRGRGFPVLKHFTVECFRISYLAFEAGAMPKLERLELCLNAQGWDRYGGVPAGIEYLSGLKEVIGNIAVHFAKGSNRRAAESALRDVAGLHPGHPVSNIKLMGGRYGFDGYDDEPREEEDGNSSSA
ncbi:disease resistance protein RGA5-like isoform X2 [Miscanthus floridulus]|uniref:disease resistance protein RGA5-like isoform X2 n=1 Tax=Miscanthus floridulus TaxID=154761 RepID=UPI003459C871